LRRKKKSEKCREEESCRRSSGWSWIRLRGRKLRRKGKKKMEGYGKKQGERNEKEKGEERKYNYLMNEDGIIIVKFEVLLFIMLTFLLK
jgi:hypothetical protein